MPRYRRKTNTRRRFRRKKISPSYNFGPLAVSQKSKLIYNEAISLNAGLASLASYVFSANGVYDPNITGSGHQPRGFDQLIALYDHCTVIASKLILTASNTDASNPVNVALMCNDDAGVVTLQSDVMENRYLKYCVLSPRDGGSSTKSLSIALNPSKFLGKSKPMSCNELQNSLNSNPPEQAFYQIYAWNSQGADVGTVDMTVRIEYTVIWHEPKQPSAS